MTASLCSLCHADAVLLRSHILPKFTQKRMKQGGAKIVARSSSGRERRVEDFAFEPLLCKKCEQRFGRFEEHAARVFYQQKKFELPKLPSGNTVHVVSGLSYTLLKLYLLSVLWRMSVSRLADFQSVKLGPHQETLRNMLLSGNPGKPEYCGTMLQVVVDSNGRIPMTRVADRYRGDQATTLYRLLVDGFLLTWFVAADTASIPLPEFVLREDGTWSVAVRHYREIPFLHEVIQSLKSPKSGDINNR